MGEGDFISHRADKSNNCQVQENSLSICWGNESKRGKIEIKRKIVCS